MATKVSENGFTLTELAVVLVIISLLMGGLLVPLSAQREVENRRSTNQQLNNIREALIAFATINGRLPCPDVDNNGLEESFCTSDATTDGFLPWQTMAVPQFDAWGNSWRYRIERGYANTATLKSLILQGGDDCYGSDTAFPSDCINVYNNAGLRLNSDREHPVAIVYSLGPNMSADTNNASYEASRAATPTYQSDVPATNFDDILVWVNRSSILTPLMNRGQLP